MNQTTQRFQKNPYHELLIKVWWDRNLVGVKHQTQAMFSRQESNHAAVQDVSLPWIKIKD